MKTELLDIRLMDCMDLMREFPDKHFDLAIVDPPYGIGEDGSKNHTRGKMATAQNYKPFAGNDKHTPDLAYFSELSRVSKNQIAWGANHYIDKMPRASSCWIVWDKVNGGNDFADCELAWTSFKSAVRKFTFCWNGMLQGDMKNKETRIHPTQKPVALYRWLLANYAKEGMKILDTHLGSGSHAIACHYAKMHLTACELDPDYYAAACERIERETRQLTLL
jgi:site-specific DNA-methyltransferase (adenine-specific)